MRARVFVYFRFSAEIWLAMFWWIFTSMLCYMVDAMFARSTPPRGHSYSKIDFTLVLFIHDIFRQPNENIGKREKNNETNFGAKWGPKSTEAVYLYLYRQTVDHGYIYLYLFDTEIVQLATK